MRLQKWQDTQRDEQAAESDPPPTEGNKKKRKASDDEDTIRKRTRPDKGLPEGFFDAGQEQAPIQPTLPSPTTEIKIPSRPATPAKPAQEQPKRQEVDEDEWAAFEADIAAAEAPTVDDYSVISAPAMTAAELAERSKEESNAQRRERQEAELEGDKEDAARKMEEELEEMEGLEERVRRLREKREALRNKESLMGLNKPEAAPAILEKTVEEDDEEDEDYEDDDWDAFRMR